MQCTACSLKVQRALNAAALGVKPCVGCNTCCSFIFPCRCGGFGVCGVKRLLTPPPWAAPQPLYANEEVLTAHPAALGFVSTARCLL